MTAMNMRRFPAQVQQKQAIRLPPISQQSAKKVGILQSSQTRTKNQIRLGLPETILGIRATDLAQNMRQTQGTWPPMMGAMLIISARTMSSGISMKTIPITIIQRVIDAEVPQMPPLPIRTPRFRVSPWTGWMMETRCLIRSLYLLKSLLMLGGPLILRSSRKRRKLEHCRPPPKVKSIALNSFELY